QGTNSTGRSPGCWRPRSVEGLLPVELGVGLGALTKPCAVGFEVSWLHSGSAEQRLPPSHPHRQPEQVPFPGPTPSPASFGVRDSNARHGRKTAEEMENLDGAACCD